MRREFGLDALEENRGPKPDPFGYYEGAAVASWASRSRRGSQERLARGPATDSAVVEYITHSGVPIGGVAGCCYSVMLHFQSRLLWVRPIK